MANETYLRGDYTIVSIWDETLYKPTACLTSSTQDETMSFAETVTMCNPGVTVSNPTSWSGTVTIEGLLIDTTSVGGETARMSWDALRSVFRNKELVDIKLATDTLAPEYASAYIESLSKTGTAGENITFSATLRLMGLPTTTDPNQA